MNYIVLLCIVIKNTNTMEKLNVNPSTHQHRLSYNDWVKEFKVGSGYVEPTKYFEGHKNWSMEPIGVCRHLYESELERFFRVLYYKIRRMFSR